MSSETQTVIKLIPSIGMHIRRTSTGEIYPDYIYPAQGLTTADFSEVTDAEYAQYIASQSDASDLQS